MDIQSVNRRKRRKIIRESISGITKPAIQRLYTKAGIARATKSTYEEARKCIYVMTDHLILKSLKNMHKREGKILKKGDVQDAIKKLHLDKVECNDSDFDFSIPKLSFRRLVQELTINIGDHLRCQNPAMLLMQFIVERELVSLFKNANLITMRSSRKTLFAKDIEIVTNIMKAGKGLC